MNVFIASEELRRNNSRAVKERNRWRQRYALTSEAIRTSKHRLRAAQHSASIQQERSELVVLHALRMQANILMMVREDISCELRDTAYPWAPREALA